MDARSTAIEQNWKLAEMFPDVVKHANRAAAHTIRNCILLHKRRRDKECATTFSALLDRYPNPESVEASQRPQQLSAAICYAVASTQKQSSQFLTRAKAILRKELERGLLTDPECCKIYFNDEALRKIRESSEFTKWAVKPAPEDLSSK